MSPKTHHQLKIEIARKLISDCLDHFGPDPVTRGWCHEARKSYGLWRFTEVLDESKEPRGRNLRRHTLTDKRINRGLTIMVRDYRHHFANLFDDTSHDAPLADLLVQCSIFGTEKYA